MMRAGCFSCVLVQVDMCSMEEVDEIARRPCSIPISCSLKLNMDGLLERIWDMMALVRMDAGILVAVIARTILE
jgi:ribosome-interacting GTPase 1